jgi:hypothetical protein
VPYTNIHHRQLLWCCCCCAFQVDPEQLRKLKRVDAAAISQKKKLSEMDVLAVVQNDSTYLEVSQHLLTAWACRVRVESLGSYPLLGLLGGVGLPFFIPSVPWNITALVAIAVER